MTAIVTNANHWNPTTTGVAQTCIWRSVDRDLVARVFEFRNITFGGAFNQSNISVEVNMFAKQFAAGLVATALLSTTALAQAPAPKDPPTGQSSTMTKTESTAPPAQTQSSSEWRSSKVVGLYVYNDANERLGSISELLMDSSGKVVKAVIGVGGFLGIGESDVAVNFDQLKFVNEPMRTTSTTSTAPTSGASDRPGGASGTVGTTATTTTTSASKPTINPDHAKISMTKEQLKAQPQFKYAN
jgi:hypothetical protein